MVVLVVVDIRLPSENCGRTVPLVAEPCIKHTATIEPCSRDEVKEKSPAYVIWVAVEFTKALIACAEVSVIERQRYRS
jgi:hypothetical protein